MEPTTKVRAKFIVQTVTDWANGQRVVKLEAVISSGDDSNKSWAKYTPNGKLEMTIDNPPAAAAFTPGKVFYLDFTPAD